VSAQDDLNAAALAYAVSQGYTPPAPPAPVYLFDGRATTIGALPTTSGSGQTTVVTPKPPPPPYEGILYQGTDMRVTTDPTGRYAKVYTTSPAAGHHNPYWTTAPPSITSAQINKLRPTVLGETCWYANACWLDSLTYPDWGAWLSLGYQVILNDQVQLGPRSSASGHTNVWTISQNAGLVSNGRPAVAYTQALKPATTGQWTDWIIGYTAAVDQTGMVEVHYRPHGGTWSQLWRQTGPTLEWSNTTGPPDPGTELNDKEGLYFGWWNQSQTPAPTGVIIARGLSRHPTLADALASLG
jgi:hypothetical protein